MGPARAAAFARLGVADVRDLAFFLPRTYRDLGRVQPVANLLAGADATARARLQRVGFVPGRRGRPPFLRASFSDGTGKLSVTWFRSFYLKKLLVPGADYYLTGKVSFSRGAGMTHPQIEPVDEARGEPGPVLAVYPGTEVLSQRTIRRAAAQALARAEGSWDWLPPQVRRARRMEELPAALGRIHRPGSIAQASRSRSQIAYRECFLFQAALAAARASLARSAAPPLPVSARIDERIRKRLPFALRPAQEKVVRQIASDLARAVPMHRLLVGEVGSGKTAVALYAALVAIASGKQAAFLAPTEILAAQHLENFRRILAGSRVRLGLLAAGVGAERARILRDLEKGALDLVVGTHALLSDGVFFSRLALVVIDEQHRFGVLQRQRLLAGSGPGAAPHRLLMTATPIPRTLERILWGDLDVSILEGLPPGRGPIVTRWVAREDRERTYETIREELAAGRQAYVVCPRLEGEGDESRSALATARRLSSGPLRRFRVGLVHGRMKSPDKRAAMEAFRSGRTQVLVATSVVEVGLDVANATVMVVEEADRFGLAQLHQLRGRIGRGEHASTCYLFADPATPEGMERLKAVVTTSDGFALAARDLAQRGPGDWFGTEQSGLGRFFRVFDPVADAALVEQARRDAFDWQEKEGVKGWPESIARELARRLPQGLALGEVG